MESSKGEHREVFMAIHRSLLYLCKRAHASAVERQCCKTSSSQLSVNTHALCRHLSGTLVQTSHSDAPIRPERVERPEPEPRWEAVDTPAYP
eukprot:5324435-Prorocentrum_lima.AAC.1